jgi:hypothetical protein
MKPGRGAVSKKKYSQSGRNHWDSEIVMPLLRRYDLPIGLANKAWAGVERKVEFSE